MIELPEVNTISKDLRKTILGKTITDIKGDFKSHKFTFYYQNPEKYRSFLVGKKITDIISRNFYIEIAAENYKIIFRDGANIRYYEPGQPEPAKSQFFIKFNDGSFLNVTVQMYACIAVFNQKEGINNEYYHMDLDGIGALDKEFTYDYFKSLITQQTLKLSAKALLATQQRIPGIGNGVLQEILFNAKIRPRTKIQGLSKSQIKKLYESIGETLSAMIKQNGRDTEKDIYDNPGKYETIMSNKNYKNGCPLCGSPITKENYLGGSVYYCPVCQK
ncbi:formamidopyrimidine-DNA glycosylase [Candidatus Saccharibacteria bacterium]|nr:formamidopyrimidine-DNA glycosylase [Candidatus Saccharibacteria bacterium]